MASILLAINSLSSCSSSIQSPSMPAAFTKGLANWKTGANTIWPMRAGLRAASDAQRLSIERPYPLCALGAVPALRPYTASIPRRDSGSCRRAWRAGPTPARTTNAHRQQPPCRGHGGGRRRASPRARRDSCGRVRPMRRGCPTIALANAGSVTNRHRGRQCGRVLAAVRKSVYLGASNSRSWRLGSSVG